VYHSVKHAQAKSPEEARALSLAKGARKGDFEASYLPEYANNVLDLKNNQPMVQLKMVMHSNMAELDLCFTKTQQGLLDIILEN
jgi:hypothetical protein